MNTRYIMSAIVIFLTSAAISAGCAVNVKENTEKQTIATKANRTDKNFGSSEAFLKNIINGLNNYPTDSRYDSAFRNNSTDKKFIFQIATVKLEVQLLHLPPPPLERSGKGGGGRCKLGFGSSGNTK